MHGSLPTGSVRAGRRGHPDEPREGEAAEGAAPVPEKPLRFRRY